MLKVNPAEDARALTQLYLVNLKFSGAEGMATLVYEDRDSADRAVDAILNAVDQHSTISVPDQRGHILTCRPREVMFAMVVDLKREIDHQQDLRIIQEHANASLQQRVQSDPKLRFLAGLNAGQFTVPGRAS